MTMSSITTTLGRIAAASSESPIAVFFIGSTASVNAVFARTFHTMNRIASGDPRFIGCFDMHANQLELGLQLRRELAKRCGQIGPVVRVVDPMRE